MCIRRPDGARHASASLMLCVARSGLSGKGRRPSRVERWATREMVAQAVALQRKRRRAVRGGIG